jgi:amino acid permease
MDRMGKDKMKNISKYIIIIYIIMGFMACSAFGTDPKGEHLKKNTSIPTIQYRSKYVRQ